MITRRALLRAAPAVGATALVPALAAPRPAPVCDPADLKLLVFLNYGGWDPTRVFAPAFGTVAAMEPGATEASAGGLRFVDHPDRPSVRAWFERHAERAVVLGGLLVPSVGHATCLSLALTGLVAGGVDWGTLVAADRAADFPLPHVVLAGPCFPGPYTDLVTRTGTNRALAALLKGDIADWSDTPVGRFSASVEARMDAAVARRAALLATGDGAAADLARSQGTALRRAATLQALVGEMNWGATALGGQLSLAADLLSLGVTRVVTVALRGWDSHAGNDLRQSVGFEALFGHLLALGDDLRALPGSAGRSLADETLVVVLSEMGRAPALNEQQGKDHWPYTSALLWGPNLAGGRGIGGFDADLVGVPVDPETGGEGEVPLDAAALGVTLLAMAGVEPPPALAGVRPLTAAMR